MTLADGTHEHDAKRAAMGDSDGATLTFGRDLQGARPLLLSEVALLLRDHRDRWQADATRTRLNLLYQTPKNAAKALEHCQAFSRLGVNREVIREARQTLAFQTRTSYDHNNHQLDGEDGSGGRKGRPLAEFEMCQLANLLPESLESAKLLIPSLAMDSSQLGPGDAASPVHSARGPVDDDQLTLILDELVAIKRFSSAL
jgi:hypothetical protein